jgi:predicted nucleotidyltransferase
MAEGFFGSLGNGFVAASDHEIRNLLSQVDATVPHRTRGRTRDHRERYCIVHYLRTLEQNGLLRYPFKLTKGERPDFRVEMGSQQLGLEVTEAGSPEHQRATTELEKSPRGSLLEGNAVRASGEPLSGRGYVGDEPERRWTAQVLAAIRKKTEQLSTYQDLPDYQLLIYDNTELVALTAWTVTELPPRLTTAIQDWRGAEPNPGLHFSRYSVLRDRVLMYDIGGSSLLLPVPPSPSQPPLLPLTRLGVLEEDLRAFCRRHHIRKLGFFGSARGERFGPRSDVDVLVEFEPAYRIGLIRLAEVELELSRLLGRKADLRTVSDLSRYFREEVVREKTDLAYVAG